MSEREGTRERGRERGREGEREAELEGETVRDGGATQVGAADYNPKPEWVKSGYMHVPPHGQPLCTYRVASDLRAGAGPHVTRNYRPSLAIPPDAAHVQSVLLHRPLPYAVVCLADLVGRVHQYRQTRGGPGVGHGRGNRPLREESQRRPCSRIS